MGAALNELALYSEGLASLAYIVGILGFIPAVISFLRKNYQEAKEKEEKIYELIAEENFRINLILMDYPSLGASWFEGESQKELNCDQKIQQAILFDMLTSLFEKTFIAYKFASDKQKGAQWRGWEKYIDDYCKKLDYREWYISTTSNWTEELGAQFDERFEEFMKLKLQQSK